LFYFLTSSLRDDMFFAEYLFFPTSWDSLLIEVLI